tara:strand:+ start:552 stop:677 length:126 start_codon:yes stop_codon:yes gene_type:complete
METGGKSIYLRKIIIETHNEWSIGYPQKSKKNKKKKRNSLE